MVAVTLNVPLEAEPPVWSFATAVEGCTLTDYSATPPVEGVRVAAYKSACVWLGQAGGTRAEAGNRQGMRN